MVDNDELIGWQFTINVAPQLYKDEIVWKPRPHMEEAETSRQYRYNIENEISKFVQTAFACDVKIELDFYLDNMRISYPTGFAHQLVRCLVPTLIAEPRLVREVIARVHYNKHNDKTWKPRTELTIHPIVGPQ